MAILHYRVTRQEQNINLNRHISAQQFTLRRAMVILVPEETANHPNDGMLIVQPNYLSGLEIVSGDNTSSNDIPIPLQLDDMTIDRRYDWNFDSEDVPEAFQVQVFSNNGNKAVFVTANDGTVNPTPTYGMVYSIDLFFEFATLGDTSGF